MAWRMMITSNLKLMPIIVVLKSDCIGLERSPGLHSRGCYYSSSSHFQSGNDGDLALPHRSGTRLCPWDIECLTQGNVTLDQTGVDYEASTFIMLITLVLLSLSLTPVIVISSPLNVEPIDITQRETACIAKSNCGITNDNGGKPGKPKPNPVDPQSPYDAQPALPNPSGKPKPDPNPNTKPTDLLTAPDIQWPDPDKGPELFDFEYKCTGRSQDDQLLVLNELLVARDILQKGYTIFSLSPFYQAMFAPSLRNNPSFELQPQTKYAYAFAILSRSDYKVKITCDQNLCEGNTVALVIAQLNILNLCEPWYDDKVKARSEVAANECKAGNEKANSWKNLAKLS